MTSNKIPTGERGGDLQAMHCPGVEAGPLRERVPAGPGVGVLPRQGAAHPAHLFGRHCRHHYLCHRFGDRLRLRRLLQGQASTPIASTGGRTEQRDGWRQWECGRVRIVGPPFLLLCAN